MSEFETLLDRCIEALREGRWSVDDCLRRYPEHAAALGPHLRAVAAFARAHAAQPREAFAQAARERFLVASGERIADAFAVQPREEFAREARERFLVASGERIAEALDAEPSPSFFAAARVRFLMAAHRMRQAATPAPRRLPVFGSPLRALAGAAAALVLFMSFSTYTVASASSSLPGDWRYPIKLQTERVRLALAFSEDAKRDVRLDIAEERGREIERLARKGRIIGPGELDRLAEQTAPLVDDAASDWAPEDLDRLKDVANKQAVLLKEVAPQVAPSAQDELEQAAAVSHDGVIAASQAIAGQGRPDVIKGTVPVTTPTPAPAESPTGEPTAPADASPTAPVETPAPASPTAMPGLNVDPSDPSFAHGVTWIRLSVGGLTMMIPSPEDGWNIAGINVVGGKAAAPALVRLSNRDGTSLVTVNPRNGDMYWFIARGTVFDEVQMRLTTDGQTLVIDREALRTLYGEDAEVPLFMLDSIELAPPPTPTATSEAAVATETAAGSATP